MSVEGAVKRLVRRSESDYADSTVVVDNNDLIVALALLERADEVMSEMDNGAETCPCCGGEHHTPKCALNNWRTDFKAAKGE